MSERGIINVVLKGIPAKRHIKINTLQIINLFANGLETSFQKIKKLDCENFDTNSNNTNNNKKSNKEIYKEKFIKPTLEQVEEYCLERNNGIDAQKFIDFYESKGWYVGKNKMKDWKACVRTWEKQSKKPYVVQKQELPNWFDEEQDIHIITNQEEEEMKIMLMEMQDV